MNKQELIKSMAEKSKLTQKDCNLALEVLIESIEEAVANKEKVQLVGFGSFEAVERKEKEVPVNPKKPELGRKIMPSKYVPVFSAGKEFKDKVAK